jgi:hypothetical protein|tara:strand:- start:45 stop:632 length:588 start_codon:yes stop_codon:yes gene_type:complete
MIDSLYAEGYRAADFNEKGSTPVSMVVGESQHEQPRYTQLHGIYTAAQPAKTRQLLALSLAERKMRTEAEQETARIAKKKITDSIANLQKGLTARVTAADAVTWELQVIASIPKADMAKAVQSGSGAVKSLVEEAKRRTKEDEHPLVQRTAVKLALIIKGLKADGRYTPLRNQLNKVCKGFEKEHEALKALKAKS